MSVSIAGEVPVSQPEVVDKEVTRASVKVAFACSIGMFCGTTPMVASTQSLFMGPLEREFDLSRATVSMVLLAMPIVVALTAPLGGYLLDRFGVRRVILPTILVFIATNFLLSRATTVGQIVLYFMLLGACGSIHAYPAYTKVLAGWFRRNRGLVTSLMIACGSSFGAILMPQVVRYMIDGHGWRSAYLSIATIIAVVGLPVIFLFLRENRKTVMVAGNGEPEPVNTIGSSFGEALRDRVLWTIVGGIALSVIALYGTIFHTVPMLAERGLSSSVAAIALSAFFTGGMIAQLTVGLFLDRVANPKVALPFFGLAVIGVFLMHSMHLPILIYLGALFMGFAQGSEHTIASYFITRYFGLKAYGSIYGINWGVASISVVIGALSMGAVHDMTGSYSIMGIVLPLSMACVVLLYATLPPYRVDVRSRA